LRPKKAKELIPEVAKELDLPEQMIKDITDFYWQEVRKSLSSLKHSRVHITNLGDFTIKHWKLDDMIEMLERFKENLKQKGVQEKVTRFRTDENLFDMKAMKKIMEEEQTRKEFIKLHKTSTDEPKRKYNKAMENKRSDTRGSD
jgi:nucleoid DNA-binding protein